MLISPAGSGTYLLYESLHHNSSRQSSVYRVCLPNRRCVLRDDLMTEDSTTDDLVIRSPSAKRHLFPLKGLFRLLGLFLSGGEDAFFVTADALVRVQAFKNKFGS